MAKKNNPSGITIAEGAAHRVGGLVPACLFQGATNSIMVNQSSISYLCPIRGKFRSEPHPSAHHYRVRVQSSRTIRYRLSTPGRSGRSHERRRGSRRCRHLPAGYRLPHCPEYHVPTLQTNEGSTLQPHLLSVFIISSAGGFCNARFVQSYKSFLYIINYFVILYILQLHLYVSRGHLVLVVLPCLLHGIGGKKELARCGINFNVACYIPELCCHGNPCLSALLWFYYSRHPGR